MAIAANKTYSSLLRPQFAKLSYIETILVRAGSQSQSSDRKQMNILHLESVILLSHISDSNYEQEQLQGVI
jgi:hypothetical protein